MKARGNGILGWPCTGNLLGKDTLWGPAQIQVPEQQRWAGMRGAVCST